MSDERTTQPFITGEAARVYLREVEDLREDVGGIRESVAVFSHRIEECTAAQRDLAIRIFDVERQMVGLHEIKATLSKLDGWVDDLRMWRGKVMGAAVAISILAGAVGGLVIFVAELVLGRSR